MFPDFSGENQTTWNVFSMGSASLTRCDAMRRFPKAATLLARTRGACVAGDLLPVGLKRWGAIVDVVLAYRTRPADAEAGMLRQHFQECRIDVITFTSSATVTAFADLLGRDHAKPLLEGVMVARIGPVTAETAARLGFAVDIVPAQRPTPALAEALARH
jgi:uroporphyrinogen III methyltransferase/synthase